MIKIYNDHPNKMELRFLPQLRIRAKNVTSTYGTKLFYVHIETCVIRKFVLIKSVRKHFYYKKKKMYRTLIDDNIQGRKRCNYIDSYPIEKTCLMLSAPHVDVIRGHVDRQKVK